MADDLGSYFDNNASPTATAPAPQAGNGILDHVKQALGHNPVLDKAVDLIGGKLLPTAVEAGNAVFGAPQRAVAGAMSSPGDAVYGVFHPNDPAVEQKAEDRVGVTAFKKYLISQGANEKAVNLATDLVFQTATDPLTYLGPGLGRIILRGGSLGMEALWHAVPKLEDLLRPSVDLRRGVSALDAAKQETIRARHSKFAQELNATVLNKGKSSGLTNEEINGRVESTPNQARQDLHNLGSQHGISGLADLAETASKTGKENAEAATAAKAQIGQQIRSIREKRIEDEARREGLQYVPAVFGEPRGTLGKLAHSLSSIGKGALFQNALPHMFNIGVMTWLHGGESTLAKGMALFANPKFYRADGKGAAEFNDTFQEMSHYAASSHFSDDAQILTKVPGIAQIGKANQAMLDRFETAMRYAHYEGTLKKQAKIYGDTEDARYMAGAMVRRHLGDYENASKLTNMLSNQFGAPFAQWRFVAIPSSIGPGLAANPQRGAQYFRAINELNQDELGDQKYDVDPSKPIDEAMKAVTHPATYGTSTSSIGPLGIIPRLIKYPPKGHDIPARLGSEAMEEAATYIPYASAVESIMDVSPFHSNAPEYMKQALNLIGSYTKNKKPGEVVQTPSDVAPGVQNPNTSSLDSYFK